MKALYNKPVPPDTAGQETAKRSLRRRKTATLTATFCIAILALLALIGVVAVMFVLEFADLGMDLLLFGIMGGLALLAIGCAVAVYFLMKHGELLGKRFADLTEQCDGAESFFVGDTTLLTFGKEGIVLHDDTPTPPIRVPYARLRFFSICMRKYMREKGEWAVLIEIPANFLQKDGEGTALIRADAKPRLYACIEAHGLELLGEKPQGDLETFPKTKYKAEQTFSLPNKKSQHMSLILGAVGLMLIGAGIAIAVLIKPLTLGAILAAFGAVVLGRAIGNFMRARAVFVIAKEGIFWRDTGESIFLKWEEITGLHTEESPAPILAVECAYGAYRFPRAAGVWEELCKIRGDLCK